MPIIERAEGRRLISEIYGVMHYPAEKDRAKRDKLADWFEARRFAWDVEEKIEAGNRDRYTNWHIKVLSRGRTVEQMGGCQRKIALSAFYAAHWLRFRLYMGNDAGASGSHGKWERYIVNHLFPNTESRRWPHQRDTLNQGRKAYASVAHLWLACMDNVHFADKVVEGPDRDGGLIPFAVSLAPFFGSFLQEALPRAQALHHAALAMGIFRDPRNSVKEEHLWRLPDSIKPTPLPPFATADFVVRDFDREAFLQRYEPVSREYGNPQYEDAKVVRKTPRQSPPPLTDHEIEAYRQKLGPLPSPRLPNGS
jgi:hypothetical protein